MVERTTKKCFVTIYTSRPGFVIGKKGNDIEEQNNYQTDLMINSNIKRKQTNNF